MAINLDAYFRTRRFTADPFATTSAEQERSRLRDYFIHTPWFSELIGDPYTPDSFVVFAAPGAGKTSHRLEVARIVSERRTAPALPISLVDFDIFLHENTHLSAIDAYLPVIRRLTLEELDRQIQQWPEREGLLRQTPTGLTQLHALLQLFAPLRSFGRYVMSDTKEAIRAYQNTELSVRAWLTQLAQLAGQAGFASIYVLVDGVDELIETHNDTERMIRLIAPLLEAPGLLQGCGYAFKFFLPEQLCQPMLTQKIGRWDRISYRTLSWTETALQTVLAQRLQSYSRLSSTSNVSFVNRFQDLCELEADVDTVLAHFANGSPRQLLKIARAVIQHHCTIVDNTETPIGHESIEWALRALVDSDVSLKKVTLDFEASVLSVNIVSPSNVPLLWLDSRGDVWIGDQRTFIELPKLLQRCLLFLWEHRDKTVPYEELQKALYGDSLRVRGDPKSSCDKIIRRIRSILEPGKPGSRTYIDIKPGIGYVLRNVQD